jgi:AraC family transcriptional regulator
MNVELRSGEFYGGIAARCACGHAVLSDVVHHCGRRLPEHTHERAYFSMLLHGGYRERLGSRTIDYQPYQVAYRPARLAHSDVVGPAGGRFLCLEVDAGIDDDDLLRRAVSPLLLDCELSLLLARLGWRNAAGMLDATTLESVTFELLGAAAGMRSSDERGVPRWLEHCDELLHAQYTTSVRVADLARALDVHPVHLTRVFRRRHGRTIGGYVHVLRLRAACAAFARGDESLAQIAARLGYADQSHLTRRFKSAIGCSPAMFRRLAASHA